MPQPRVIQGAARVRDTRGIRRHRHRTVYHYHQSVERQPDGRDAHPGQIAIDSEEQHDRDEYPEHEGCGNTVPERCRKESRDQRDDRAHNHEPSMAERCLGQLLEGAASEDSDAGANGRYYQSEEHRGSHLLSGWRNAMKVILVDDVAKIRDLVQVVLEMDGFVVAGHAQDGVEAVDLVRKLQPDAVVMDVTMPRMDGIAATRLIKEQAPHVAVVALSSSVNPYDMKQMLDAGASAYIAKTDIDELAAVLANLRSGALKAGSAGADQSATNVARAW